MKKLQYICSGLVICACAVALSCTREDVSGKIRQGQSNTATLSIEDARAFFEGFVTELNVPPFHRPSSRNGTMPAIAPQWDKASSFLFDNQSTVEAPFNTAYFSIQKMVSDENLAGLSEADRYRNSRSLLVATLDEDGDIRYRTAVLTADPQWLMQRGKRLVRLSLDNLSDFSGRIRFYELDGTLSDGVIYRGGKVVGRIFASEEEKQKRMPASRAWVVEEVCAFVEYEVETCWYSGYMEEGVEYITSIDCTYNYVWEFECWTVGYDDGEEDGNGDEYGEDYGEEGDGNLENGHGEDDGYTPPPSSNTTTPTEIVNSLQSKLSNSDLKTLINRLDSQSEIKTRVATDNDNVDDLRIQVRFSHNDPTNIWGVEIIYTESFMSSIAGNEMAREICFLHEFGHPFMQQEEGVRGGQAQHDAMIDDPGFLQGLRDICPGQSDEWYDMVRLYGCADSEAWGNLTKEEQDAHGDLYRAIGLPMKKRN